MKIVIEILDGEITQIVSVNNGFDTNLHNKTKFALSRQKDDDAGIADLDTGPASFNTEDISVTNTTKNNIDLSSDVSAGPAPEIP